MLVPFRALLFFIAVVTGMLTSFSVFAEEVVFDRLDGKGPSGKRVDVIEWEGNLEVHVYPKGSLNGISAKLDDREEGKKVMVIGYRFSADKKAHPLVRRAILGVPFTAKINAFIDRTDKDCDKLAFSNKGLTAPWAPYKMDTPPAQWYPDGHPSNKTEEDTRQILGERQPAAPPAPTSGARRPASAIQDTDFEGEETDKKAADQEGQIKPFTW